MRHLSEVSCLFQCRYPKVWRLFKTRRLLEEIQYMESSKDSCAKYYQVNKQTTAKKPSESYQKLSKEE